MFVARKYIVYHCTNLLKHLGSQLVLDASQATLSLATTYGSQDNLDAEVICTR